MDGDRVLDKDIEVNEVMCHAFYKCHNLFPRILNYTMNPGRLGHVFQKKKCPNHPEFTIVRVAETPFR